MDSDLFSEGAPYEPLASRLRPNTLDEYIGQQHVVGQGTPLRRALDSGQIHSVIFWGPPGVGKTTLARLIAHYVDAQFLAISAVMSGVKEIREAVERAKQVRAHGRKTLLFIDEVHRFNKSQQDAFLPHVEKGTVIFIGATTENPSFELNNALLSRARIFVLNTLSIKELQVLLRDALENDEQISSFNNLIEDFVLEKIAIFADGDARRALNLLELCVELLEAEKINNDSVKIDEAFLDNLLQGQSRRFDKGGDIFYEQISALHKAVRGSSPDASIYRFSRLLDGGCDPSYIARRLLRLPSVVIGNADP